VIFLLKIVLNPSNLHICIKWVVQQNLVMCHYDYFCYNSYVLTACLLPFDIKQLEENTDILTVSTEQERESFTEKLSEVNLKD
jgi:hypothetical protein